MKRLVKVLLISSLMMLLCISFAFAKELSFTVDGNTVNCEEKAKSCYLVFDDASPDFKINEQSSGHPEFLHQYIELAGDDRLVLEGTMPIEMHFFDTTDVPEWVQIWEEPCDKADLLLISSHADDEQLFFAGILPYYSQVKGLKVQVAYATDHNGEKVRHHERLNGLWAVGIRNYPVSTGYPDLYSESAEGAFANLAQYGITEEDLIAWEKEQIAKFEPKVIVTHDLNGEYGHGMHMAVSRSLTKALEYAQSEFPFLCRAYLHLYDQNEMTLDVIDQNFAELGGKTPFEITKELGFACHKSQHWTWFKGWIEGSHTTYSPLKYGCYYLRNDISLAEHDFFNGLTSYEEDRVAEEKFAEAQRAAEEAERKAEEERLLKEKQTKYMYAAAICGGVILIIIAVALIKRNNKKEKYIAKH